MPSSFQVYSLLVESAKNSQLKNVSICVFCSQTKIPTHYHTKQIHFTPNFSFKATDTRNSVFWRDWNRGIAVDDFSLKLFQANSFKNMFSGTQILCLLVGKTPLYLSYLSSYSRPAVREISRTSRCQSAPDGNSRHHAAAWSSVCAAVVVDSRVRERVHLNTAVWGVFHMQHRSL